MSLCECQGRRGPDAAGRASSRRAASLARYAAEPPVVTLRGRSRTGKIRRRWGGLRLGVEVLFRTRRRG